MCSVPQSARSNVAVVVIGFDMAEMAGVAVGMCASCMVAVPVGQQVPHVLVPQVHEKWKVGDIPQALVH